MRAIEWRLRDNPVVAVLGARQVGKTTIARAVAERRRGQVTHFDLENPADLARLADPMLGLRRLRGLVVLDEVQRLPEVFSVLRVLADRPRKPARFLILGSASPDLLQQSSESLAGRVAYYWLPGFGVDEVAGRDLDKLWVRGGFPRSFLARGAAASVAWRRDFITTFLERDVPQFGIRAPAPTLRRFWMMLAHYHGQTWNASEIARSMDVSNKQAKWYLDVLSSLLVVRQLQPWFDNVKKRQVKSPKIYLRDTGLLHSLLGIEGIDALESHPKVGASWEGFILQQICDLLALDERDVHFWATHAGAELDLLALHGGRKLGFEIKRTVAPRITRSMRVALDDLALDELVVVHAGTDSYPMDERIRAMAASRMTLDLPRGQ